MSSKQLQRPKKIGDAHGGTLLYKNNVCYNTLYLSPHPIFCHPYLRHWQYGDACLDPPKVLYCAWRDQSPRKLALFVHAEWQIFVHLSSLFLCSLPGQVAWNNKSTSCGIFQDAVPKPALYTHLQYNTGHTGYSVIEYSAKSVIRQICFSIFWSHLLIC